MKDDVFNFNPPRFLEVPEGEIVMQLPFEDMLDLYQTNYPDMARSLALLGKETKQIATFFCVTVPVIRKWCQMYPEFHASLRDGSDLADSRVATALYNRAIGMTYQEESIVKCPDGTFNIVKLTKEVLPDVTAADKWLKARQSEKWKETKALEVTTAEKKKLSDLFLDEGSEDDPEQESD